MENYIKNLIRNIWTKWTSTRNQVHRYQTNKHLSKTQGSHKTAEMLQALSLFLQQHYQFRFNLLTEGTEFKEQGNPDSPFRPVSQRDLNSFCQSAQQAGIDCWDRDISRFVYSNQIAEYHPFQTYLSGLPAWDGQDRITALAQRVAGTSLWINGFHRWMLGMTAGWMNLDTQHGNSVAPILVSRLQGMHKSTFCKLLLPDPLRSYYTDSVDLNSQGMIEQKLALFGLINLDEFDKIPLRKMALLKNLMQMTELNIRKAYQKNFRPLPRIASFIATSNRKDLLSDPSGSRRFLCVEIEHKIDISPIDYEQVYAQLKTELLNGERYWFTTEEEAEIQQSNTGFYKQTVEEELFFATFRPSEKSSNGELLSSAEIFRRMKKRHPSAMRGMTLRSFSLLLPQLGLSRIHTHYGNVYAVEEI